MNGSIRKRPDRPQRPWLARYRGPDARERSRSFARKIDAERWLRTQVARIDRGEWISPDLSKVTFADWADEWIAGLVGLKPKTLAGYRSLLRSRVLPTFGQLPLNTIDPPTVRRWVADMEAEGLSPSRIGQARQVLLAALEQAVVDGMLPRNAAKPVKVPPVRPRAMRFLTARQVAALAEAAGGRLDGADVLVFTLAYTGIRWGEAVALRREACQLHRRRLVVAEAATEIGGELVFGTPKSHRKREIPLPQFLINMLAVRLEGIAEGAQVFTAPAGGPLRVGNFRKTVWLPAVADVGVDGLRVHDLRHTAASLAISSGASIKAVQRMLGHSSAKVTLDHYGHLYEDDLDTLADRLDERFRAADVDPVRTNRGPNVVALEAQ